MIHKIFLPLLLSLLLIIPSPALAEDVAPAPEEPAATDSAPSETEDTTPVDRSDEISDSVEDLDPWNSTTDPTFESQDSTEPTQVIEVPETIDYNGPLASILQELENLSTAMQYCTGFLLFFVVVVLCFFSYKFFKIFF